MLADWQGYLSVWQLPLLVISAAGWIFGGGYLLQWSILRHQPQSKIRPGRCMLVAAAAGTAGAISGMVIFMLLRAIGTAIGVRLIVVGMLFGAAAMLALAYLVVYVMLGMSVRQTLTISALPAGGVVLLGIIIAVGAGVPTYYLRQRELRRIVAVNDIRRVAMALRDYQVKISGSRQRQGGHPEQLDALVEQNIIDAPTIRPGGPNAPARYFYLRPPADRMPDAQMFPVACEIRKHQGGRAVLVVNAGQFEGLWMSETAFEKLLAQPENEAFAKGFRAAAGK
jgi:hypothetical protein